MEVTPEESLLPPSAEGEKKRTSWINENFEDDAPSDEDVKETSSPEEEDSVSPLHDIPGRHAATTAMSPAVGDAEVGGRLRDMEPATLTPGGGEGSALLEVDVDPKSEEASNGKVTSHRALPSLSHSALQSRGGAGSSLIKLKHTTLRPLEDSSHYDLQVSILEREKQIVSKTDSFIMYKIETKVLL